MHRNSRPAVAYFADYALALLHSALHRRAYRMIDRNSSRIRRDVNIEASVRRHAQIHIARTGANVPEVFRRAIGANIAATSFGTESAIYSLRRDVTRARADVDVAGADF